MAGNLENEDDGFDPVPIPVEPVQANPGWPFLTPESTLTTRGYEISPGIFTKNVVSYCYGGLGRFKVQYLAENGTLEVARIDLKNSTGKPINLEDSESQKARITPEIKVVLHKFIRENLSGSITINGKTEQQYRNSSLTSRKMAKYILAVLENEVRPDNAATSRSIGDARYLPIFNAAVHKNLGDNFKTKEKTLRYLFEKGDTPILRFFQYFSRTGFGESLEAARADIAKDNFEDILLEMIETKADPDPNIRHTVHLPPDTYNMIRKFFLDTNSPASNGTAADGFKKGFVDFTVQKGFRSVNNYLEIGKKWAGLKDKDGKPKEVSGKTKIVRYGAALIIASSALVVQALSGKLSSSSLSAPDPLDINKNNNTTTTSVPSNSANPQKEIIPYKKKPIKAIIIGSLAAIGLATIPLIKNSLSNKEKDDNSLKQTNSNVTHVETSGKESATPGNTPRPGSYRTPHQPAAPVPSVPARPAAIDKKADLNDDGIPDYMQKAKPAEPASKPKPAAPMPTIDKKADLNDDGIPDYMQKTGFIQDILMQPKGIQIKERTTFTTSVTESKNQPNNLSI